MGEGGVTANRVGLFGGALFMSFVLVYTSVRPAGRTLNHAFKLHHFFTVFLCFAITGMAVGSYTTGLRCEAAKTEMYKNSACSRLLWENVLQGLLALVCMQMLAVARRLEAGMLMMVMRGDGQPSDEEEQRDGDSSAGSMKMTAESSDAVMAAPRAAVLRADEASKPLVTAVLIRTHDGSCGAKQQPR
jgi:hypothetical protein